MQARRDRGLGGRAEAGRRRRLTPLRNLVNTALDPYRTNVTIRVKGLSEAVPLALRPQRVGRGLGRFSHVKVLITRR